MSEGAFDIGPSPGLSGLHRPRYRHRLRRDRHLLHSRQYPDHREQRQNRILERRRRHGDHRHGGRQTRRCGLHAHRGQRRRQRGHPAQLRPQSDLLRRLRLSLLVVVLSLLLGSRLLGRLGGMALSLQRLLRVHGRFAADGNAGPPGRPGERQETAYRMGQLHRRPADLRRRPQPAAHDRRRRAGIRTVSLPGQIV